MNTNLKNSVSRGAALVLMIASMLSFTPTFIAPAHAGVLGGAQSGWTVLGGYDSNFYDLRLRGGETTWIRVSGDGSSDLDLFIYDEFGNLIDSDERWSDECYVSVSPRWTGYFRIVLMNRGVAMNGYSIWTN